jgi:hypothetical protein
VVVSFLGEISFAWQKQRVCRKIECRKIRHKMERAFINILKSFVRYMNL